MRTTSGLVFLAFVLIAGCRRAQEPAPAAEPAPPSFAAGRLFVTNEQGGDISVIDVAAQKVVASIPVGKRPRGIRVSPDGTTLYVALSGSPIAPPGVDEDTLPPADKSADGIGVVSVRDQKLLRVVKAGSDPEQTAVTKDGTKLFVANEDVARRASSRSPPETSSGRSRWAGSRRAWTCGRTARSSMSHPRKTTRSR
jgi:YVTN family beta-propeller protein